MRVSHRQMDHLDGQPSPNYFPGGSLGNGIRRSDKRRGNNWTRLTRQPLKALGFILGAVFSILVAIDWYYFHPLDPDPAATARTASGNAVAKLAGPALAAAKAAEMAKKYTVRLNTFRRNDLLKQVMRRNAIFCFYITHIQCIPLDSFKLESEQCGLQVALTSIIVACRFNRWCHST